METTNNMNITRLSLLIDITLYHIAGHFSKSQVGPGNFPPK
ncbi:MAG: hypothetical protein OP8BY_0696 [Candidatus Saccharicenans subterraneus]|uniref:Uncharacterized protein n=1 Tax=Candidatus Saccharicenans subterraneus TaxID=2508984 RepID=A0A3E2BK00_9BACT|nr:MAG: hypothetical protein OP8BY_0696 [Candidatus Saccharicenans subterraneum]